MPYPNSYYKSSGRTKLCSSGFDYKAPCAEGYCISVSGFKSTGCSCSGETNGYKTVNGSWDNSISVSGEFKR